MFRDDRFLTKHEIGRRNDKYIKNCPQLPRLTIHEYRHSHACYMLHTCEIPVKLVSARLGHKDANETLNTYAHLQKIDYTHITDKMQSQYIKSQNIMMT